MALAWRIEPVRTEIGTDARSDSTATVNRPADDDPTMSLRRLRRVPPSRKRALATVSLGLSILAAVVAVGYFWWRGEPLTGAVIGLLVLAAGAWEFWSKAIELHEEEKAEAEAERRRERDRR